LFFLLIAAVSFPVAAQDKTSCEPAALIKQLATLKSTGDSAKDIAALLKIKKQIDAQYIACNGMTWTARAAKILGPFELPKGAYKSILTTKGYFIGEFAAIEGECEVVGSIFYNIFEGQANDGSEQLLTSQGCTAVIKTSNVSASWTLTIEPFNK
jgi:hypothetical protein